MQVLHCAPYRDSDGKPHWDAKQYALDTLGPNWMELIDAEDAIIETLSRHLDDDYHLVCNAVLLESGPDADMILVGPNGVWAIEFMHHPGDFKASHDDWLAYDSTRKDYSPSTPDPLAAARDNAGAVYELLHSQNLPVPWVNPVVILTDPSINVYSESPTVAIIRREEVYQFVNTDVRDLDPVMDEADVAAIVQALRPYFSASAVLAPASVPVKEVPKQLLGMSSRQWAMILLLAILNICVLIGFAWLVMNGP
jgi:hypothetical protein